MPEKEITVNWYTYQLVEKPFKSSLDFEEWEKYYYIQNDWNVWYGSFYEDNYCKPYIVFKTKEEAQREIDVKKAIYEIKKYSEEKWGLYKPIWNNYNIWNHVIYYDYDDKQLACNSLRISDYWCFIYFEKQKHAEEIIEKFEPQLKIIFNIK